MPSARSLPQQLGQRLLFQVAQAGGRLVEQQQAGIGGQRAGDLDDALLAERQAAGGLEHVLAEADALDLAGGLGEQAVLLGAVEAQRRGDERPCWPRRWAPMATFSSTDIWPSRRTCWKVRLMPRRAISRAASGLGRLAEEARSSLRWPG